MILIDTSAWVEFLRATDSPVCRRVDLLLDQPIAICQPIRMEIFAGARNERHLRDLRGLLARSTTIPTRPEDYESAALYYRTARQHGVTVRKLIDCLIAAHAIRRGIPLLHSDTDFIGLAQHTELVLDSV